MGDGLGHVVHLGGDPRTAPLLAAAMAKDPTIFVVGEGIGARGGNFNTTVGLYDLYGPERLRDTPISERGFVGLCTGAAMTGTRPVVDFMFIDFIMDAMGELVNQVSKIQYMSSGRLAMPMVLRGCMGVGGSAATHHSGSYYPFFVHIPGFRVVTPSNPYDAKGLFATALQCDDPVLFLEHRSVIFNKGPVPEEEYTIPFGQARIARAGTDATVVARLRAAGAILLGKSNTPEFTLGGGGKGTVNLVYGLTSNPYNVDYQPSGSSGGAGAIVAAGGSPFDIGSDYGGSIRGPAYANGIAGIKPTYGTVPRTGHIVGYGGPFDNCQEIGPLARRVEDLALIMPLINGPDDWDCAMAPVPLGDPAKVDLKKLRVAYYLTNGEVDPTSEVQAVVQQSVDMFAALGCGMTADAPPKMKELAEIRSAFGSANGREHMRRLLAKHGTKQASPGLRLDGDELPSADFTRLCEEMDAIKSEQLAWFEQYDLIICPASQSGPIRHDAERPRNRSGYSYTSQYNTTGWPAGFVRVGTTAVDALPIGVQVVAQPWRDDVVMAALAHIESQSGGYTRPPI